MKSLFLAWQAPTDSERSRAWFPVGRLDADARSPHYRFRYTHGALKAQEDLGFMPLLAFPDFERVYESEHLFPLFMNRVLSPKRTDFQEYIQWLDLERGQADPISILSVSGGERVTDNLEVFPKVTADATGHFHVRFFLHGLRHLGDKAIERAAKLEIGEELRLLVELNNPATRLAVPLLNGRLPDDWVGPALPGRRSDQLRSPCARAFCTGGPHQRRCRTLEPANSD